MGDVNGVLEFSIAILVVIVVVGVVYQVMERRKRKNIRKKFKKFSESYKVSRQNLRAVPRVVVPDSLEIILTLTGEEYPGLKANVIDMSLSGFSVKPDFPLKRLPVNVRVIDSVVETPINKFVVKEMKTVRIDHQIDTRLMAFQIMRIDEDQFESLKHFMAYLDEFLKKKSEEV